MFERAESFLLVSTHKMLLFTLMKICRLSIFLPIKERSGGGEASTSDNDKDGIHQIKEMKMKQRLRKMSTINKQQLD